MPAVIDLQVLAPCCCVLCIVTSLVSKKNRCACVQRCKPHMDCCTTCQLSCTSAPSEIRCAAQYCVYTCHKHDSQPARSSRDVQLDALSRSNKTQELKKIENMGRQNEIIRSSLTAIADDKYVRCMLNHERCNFV